MQRNFLYLFFLILAFVGCDINDLWDAWYYDACALIVFLSVSFMMLNAVKVYESKLKKIVIGKSELLLFLLLAWSATTFYFSVNAELTIFPAMKSLGALAFGLGLFLYLENKDQLDKLWLVSYIFAGIHACLGIMERFFTLFLSGDLISVEGSESLFTNQNYYSCYLLLHIPVGIYLYFKSSSPFENYSIGLGWVLLLVALGLSESQAGQIIASLQIIATIFYFMKVKELNRAKLVGSAALAALLVCFSLNQLIPVEFISASSLNIIKPEEIPSPEIAKGNWFFLHVELRIIPWVAACKIFLEHWLVGSGLWTYSRIYPFTGLLKTYEGVGLNQVPPHAHSLYFQTLSDTGLLGLALLIGCLVYLFRNKLNFFYEKERESRDLKFFLVVSTTGFLIHNIGETNWLNSLFAFYFVFLVVSLEHLFRIKVDQVKSNVIPLKRNLILIFLPFTGILIGFLLVNFYKFNQIILKPTSIDQTLSEYESGLTHAKTICARCSSPYYLSGLAKIDRYQITKNIEFLNDAQIEFSEAFVRNPYNSKIKMFQGDIFYLQGRKEEARQAYNIAMKNPLYTLLALDKIRGLGKNKEAVKPGPS